MAEDRRWQSQAWAEGEQWQIAAWHDERNQLAEPIYQIRIPLPFSLRWVNAYALHDSDGDDWTIIDPGLRTPQAETAWNEVMDKLNIHGGNLRQILLTHYHPDHLGMSGWLQEKYQVPVLLSRIGWQHAVMLWGEEQQMTALMQEQMRIHGAPVEVLEAIQGHMDSFFPLVHPLPKVTFVDDGQELLFGGRTWLAIETHGHAPGHISFFNREQAILLAGDHVLPQITPNISYMPGSDPQPLQSFLQGLEKLSYLEPELILPGHRHPFFQLHSRIAYLLEHHEERLSAWRSELARESMTAYTLCERTFGTVGRLTVHQFRFAMGETLAHLIELQRRGLIAYESSSENEVYRWHASIEDR